MVDGVTVDSGKTKDLVRQLEPITNGERSVWLLSGAGESLLRAGRNIPWLRMRTYDTVSAHDLFYSERILMSPEVADQTRGAAARHRRLGGSGR